ncbi:fimbrial protein [Cupriavidus basilensis]|uniref:Fimbrial protein n=1 Tax=Cupriavidus basilensis TaxID=68895 RepID=A0ABT6B0M8_9BURK|nr:fimbrial protein [Cupriavidus basilensis]MDF3838441.1 fimbrial protein [Cupriavidus basilensis]
MELGLSLRILATQRSVGAISQDSRIFVRGVADQGMSPERGSMRPTQYALAYRLPPRDEDRGSDARIDAVCGAILHVERGNGGFTSRRSFTMIHSLSRAVLRKWFRFVTLWAAGCAGLAASLPAEAALQCTITGSAAISFGTVTVPRDTPVGTAIGPLQSSTVSASCPSNPGSPNSGWYLQYYPKLTGSPVTGVWNTGVAGIGIRVIDVTYNNRRLSNLNIGSWDDFGAPITTGASFTGNFTFSYQLIKTAAQVGSGGPVNIPQLFTLVSHNIPANVTSPVQVTISVNNTLIVAATCTVTTPSVGVALPTVRASALSPFGTTTGNTPFNIGLSCQAGASVYVTLTDATNTGNTSSNLTLATGSTASGVKLRVLNSSGSAVSYGPDSAAAGNPNQWKVGGSASTTHIPLTAQYISTGPATPGTVKGLATFTMSYQ